MSDPKKEQNNKNQQNSKPKSDNQSTSGQPSSSGNQSKKTQSSHEKSKTEKKPKNNEQKKTDKKPRKPIDSTRQPSVKKPEELTKSSDKNSKQKNKKPLKNPKEEVVKPNLKKTDMKTLSPPKDFELTVEKICKLENSGYKIYEPIGQGSYGKVFKAKSTKYGKRLAVKVVDLNRLSDVFQKKFLVVEIELMKKIKQHKNVVKFFEIIETTDDHGHDHDHLLYISMEFYPNGDLFEYITKRHFIPERQSCIWFRQLISGVQHIHKSGFAHRDLKCENILLDSKYNIKIIDFGFCCKIRYQKVVIKKENKIVKSFDEEIPSQTFCGSVIYASPELLKGQPYCPTMTDIWFVIISSH